LHLTVGTAAAGAVAGTAAPMSRRFTARSKNSTVMS
jgi:hypothetical protein